MSQRILKLCVASLLNILCFPDHHQQQHRHRHHHRVLRHMYQHTTVSLHIKQKFPATQFLRSLRNTKVVDGW